MTIDELIENYFFYSDKINIESPKEEDEILKILLDKFSKTDRNFYNNCEDLIINTSGTSQYKGFIAGFKHGFECGKSLSDFLNKQ